MLVLNREGLIDAMAFAGYSQAELSRRSQISPRIISLMMNRQNYFCRVKTLSRLRKVLDCSMYSLIKGDINRNEIKTITTVK